MSERLKRGEPYPGMGTSDRIARKYDVLQTVLFGPDVPRFVRDMWESAYWAGAEAMFDIMTTELADLPSDEAACECARLKNAIWHKAKAMYAKGPAR
jgi:hypothetical protein